MRTALILLAAGVAGALAVSPASAQTGGQALFAANCSACHQLTGKGIPGAFPALAGDAFVAGPPPKVAALLLNGRGGMPTFRADLTDAQIASVLTYVRSAWGNHASEITPATVAAMRTGPPPSASHALQSH